MSKYLKHLIFVTIIGCYSCSSHDNSQSSINDEVIDPEVEIVDSIVISRVDSLGLVYRIDAPKMKRTLAKRQAIEEYPQGLKVTFFDNKEITQSSISAGYASVDINLVVTLKDNVKIISEKGDQLETSFLIWDQYNHKLETDKLIKLIESKGDTTYGFGLEASEDFSRFQIKRGFAGKRQFQNIKERLDLRD